MLVTEIKKIGRGDRYYVTFDYWRKVTLEAEILAKYKIKTNDMLSNEQIDKILLDNGEFACFDRALTYLEKNIKTEKGIRDYLKQKGFLPESIDDAVTKLKEYGYIDDRSYAESYIKTYANKKGKRLLKYELVLKGVDRDIIEEVLDENYSEEEEIDCCLKVMEKYCKNKTFDLKFERKLSAYLVGKGFSANNIAIAKRDYKKQLK